MQNPQLESSSGNSRIPRLHSTRLPADSSSPQHYQRSIGCACDSHVPCSRSLVSVVWFILYNPALYILRPRCCLFRIPEATSQIELNTWPVLEVPCRINRRSGWKSFDFIPNDARSREAVRQADTLWHRRHPLVIPRTLTIGEFSKYF